MSGLTKLQIKQLKNADDLCVDFSTQSHTSQIRAIKRAANSSDGYEQTAYLDIKTHVEVSRGYTSLHPLLTGETVKCYASLSSIRFFPDVQTFLSFLKEGDEVTAVFSATEPDTKNPHCYGDYMLTNLPGYEGQLLNEDRLTLRINRAGKVFSFLMEVSLTPNNSARMIKHW